MLARELAGWFEAPLAWLAVAAAILASNAWFMNEFFLAGTLDMTPFFERLPLVLVAFVPAIAMRTWSEDLRARTFELWMTLPFRPSQVVAGKYAAALTVLALFLAGTLPIVAMLCALGSPDLGRIAAGYAGAFLLGAQMLAFGQLASALFADQVLAFLAGALASAALVFSGHERVVAVLDGLAPSMAVGRRVADFASAWPRYERFAGGEIALAGVAYFVASALACLWVNALVAARART